MLIPTPPAVPALSHAAAAGLGSAGAGSSQPAPPPRRAGPGAGAGPGPGLPRPARPRRLPPPAPRPRYLRPLLPALLREPPGPRRGHGRESEGKGKGEGAGAAPGARPCRAETESRGGHRRPSQARPPPRLPLHRRSNGPGRACGGNPAQPGTAGAPSLASPRERGCGAAPRGSAVGGCSDQIAP